MNLKITVYGQIQNTQCVNCHTSLPRESLLEVSNEGIQPSSGAQLNLPMEESLPEKLLICRDCLPALSLGLCYDCSEVKPSSELITAPNREDYCEDCYGENFSTCENCDKLVENDEILNPTSRQMRRGRAFSGCTDCSARCYNCDKVVDKHDILIHDGEGYCEDCYSETFTSCDECGDVVHNEDAYYSDLTHQSYCDHCYSNNFRRCEDCGDEIERSDAIERDGNYYCENCAPDESIPEEFLEKTEKFKSFSFSKKDRVLEHLYKILPIDIKSLKANHPQIAAALQDLIVFSKGKPLTKELVGEYRASLSPETYPVAYSTWSSKLQRSISSLSQPPVTTSQLVMNILASSELLDKINSNEALRMIFTKTNELSKKSSHPMVENQIGWSRLELDPDGYFILVDEIQSDHSNVLSKLRSDASFSGEVRSRLNLSQEDFIKIVNEYARLLKDFPNIASQAIINFARSNGYRKIFWHTYESGKKLKDNAPPRSLYEQVPAEQGFSPTEERPFQLEGEFLSRTASRKYKKIIKMIRQLSR